MIDFKDLKRRIKKKNKEIVNTVNDQTGGIIETIKTIFHRFGEANGKEAAAGMAYYMLFSLFPLLLALVSIGSFFLDRQQVFNQVVNFINNTIPVSQQLIEENLQQVLDSRGTVGVVGLLTVLWSASGAFSILSRNINRAWEQTEQRRFLKQRLVALGMVAIITLLLVASLLSSVALNMFNRFEVPIINLEPLYNTFLWTLISEVLPWLIIFCLILGLYRWGPNTEVRWLSALGGAVPVTIVWAVVANAFTWILSEGVIRYRIVYGSLGALVALLFWIYLSSWIIIFGAHICATISRHADDLL